MSLHLIARLIATKLWRWGSTASQSPYDLNLKELGRVAWGGIAGHEEELGEEPGHQAALGKGRPSWRAAGSDPQELHQTGTARRWPALSSPGAVGPSFGSTSSPRWLQGRRGRSRPAGRLPC